VQPEVEELRPKLKEVLYDCAVDIRATKAALYVFDGTSRYELVTEYGFRGGIRQSADSNDPIVDRCGRGRTPFYVNGLAAEPRFSPLLYESSTDRLLVAPLYSRGKLIGFLDLRDKAAKLPFEQPDLPKAQSIADRLVELLAQLNIFGHRFIALSKLSGPQQAAPVEHSTASTANVSAEPPVRDLPRTAPAAPPARPAAPAIPAAPELPAMRTHLPRLATLVIEARSAASRIVVAPAPESIGETELDAVRDVLRSVLLIPGAIAATFSAFGHLGGVQEIAARSSVTEDAKNLLQSKLNVWLTKRGEAGGFVRTSVLTPFGTSGPAVTANDIQKVFTAPLTVGALRGLYLTVAFTGNPDRVAHELMAVLHGHLQLVLEHSMQRGALGVLRSRVAEEIVEPDFSKYPELRRHSDAVAKLSESFARFLALPAEEVENARIVGIVHDAGMRLLEYDRLYRKRDLNQEELGFLREHPTVTAAMVEPLLGNEIARAVLCHHERVDGRGYPNELHGDEIPLVSRVVQICDAWLAITDPDSYQPPEPPESALATISRGAGSQFDAELARRFAEMMRTRI
jgi:hypothetical protein